MSTQIQVSREEMEFAQQLSSLLRSGALRQMALQGNAPNLCHTRHRAEVYSLPEIRKRFANRRGMGFGQPDLKDVHIDVPLTNMSIAYRNPMYIGTLAVPRVPVVKESDYYYITDRAAWHRDEAEITAPGAASPRGGYTLSNDKYSVDEWSFERAVPDRIRDNADSLVGPDRRASEFCADKIDIKLEKLIRNLLFTAANWTGSVTLGTGEQFDDYDSSDPFNVFQVARRAVLINCGFKANTLVMGYDVYEKLSLHPDLLQRCVYTGTQDRPAMVTARMMAALFEVENVLVGEGIENTGVEGGTDAYDFIWGKKFWIGYRPDGPSIDEPSAAYVFTTGRRADRYREDRTRSDVVRNFEAVDVKVTAAGAGYSGQAVVS